ncbi:MAG: DUF2232 domain-containing protein [Gammaproteobacteria bacterium]|nr:MAG: DUF2232 domain-containing protein [Gammaproteobacteria bacterium]
MIALARFIMAGPGQASLVAASTAMLSLLLPPLAWVSGGVIALVVLHLGNSRGAQVVTLATIGSMLLSWLILGSPLVMLTMVLLLWLPVWLVAVVLRHSVSLAMAFQVTTALGVLMVLVLNLGFPQLQTLVATDFTRMLQPVLEQQPDEATRQQLQQGIDTVMRLLPGILGAGVMMMTVLSLVLGRWWQAALYNPGGFRKEFHELRLGRVMAATGLVLLLLAGFANIELAVMVVLVFLMMYLLQGTALIHSIVSLRKLNRGWLFGFYILLFFVPHLMVPLAVLGMTDAWIDYRQRLKTN